MLPTTLFKYTRLLLDFFGGIKFGDEGNYQNIPIIYANREKLLDIQQKDFQTLVSGNTSFYPRASLNLTSIEYDSNRQLNKNLVASQFYQDPRSFMSENVYVPSPYNINYQVAILVRSMSQACMIVEQICSQFKPFKEFDIEDYSGETKIKVSLDSVTFESQDNDQFKTNEILIEISLTLLGNLYSTSKVEKLARNIQLNFNCEEHPSNKVENININYNKDCEF